MIETCLEPQTTIYKWLFQLDDSQSLHRKWLEITKHPFLTGGVPGGWFQPVQTVSKVQVGRLNQGWNCHQLVNHDLSIAGVWGDGDGGEKREQVVWYTPKTNMEPEKGRFEKEKHLQTINSWVMF